MIIHDVAVTSNSARMLCVGTLTASSEGLKPSKSRAEKQIIGEREEPFFFLFPFSHTWVSKRRIVRYKLYQSSIWIKKKSNGKFCKPFSIYQDKKNLFLFRSRVPVLHDVRDITLSTKDQVALVSYENKVCLHRPPRGVGERGINGGVFFCLFCFGTSQAPPQLWKLDIVTARDIGRLTLRHTYMPKTSVDFAGPSYFGGKHDQLVLCAGKGVCVCHLYVFSTPELAYLLLFLELLS